MLPLAGVAGFESPAVSGTVVAAAAAWRDVESAEGESLASFMGVSSLGVCEAGSRSVRSLSAETLRVTSLEFALVDLRRSFAGPVVLIDGAIVLGVSQDIVANTPGLGRRIAAQARKGRQKSGRAMCFADLLDGRRVLC